MDASQIAIVLYVVALLAVIARLFKNAGWKLAPAINEQGKFQLNFVFIIVTGFVAAVPIISAVSTADPITAIVTVFTAVYGTPTVIDAGVTAVVPTKPEINEGGVA